MQQVYSLYEYGGASVYLARGKAFDIGAHCLVSRDWATENYRLPVTGMGDVISMRQSEKFCETVQFTDEYVIHSSVNNGRITVDSYAKTIEDAESNIVAVRKEFPEAKATNESVYITFWNNTSNGPQSRSRKIATVRRSAIDINYSSSVRDTLDQLFQRKLDDSFGEKLMLWYGPPGTGKTYMIRALAQEWKEFADFHYVVDPEDFFVHHAGYMLKVLLDGSDSDRWRIIVLEDAGELLSKDARLNVGQGLSRMLNVCDGFIGQGLKVLFLITTNENIGTLHEAVVRPGRCLANIEFDALSGDDMHRWVAKHKVTAPDKQSMTLAELFSLKTGKDITQKKKPRKVGFQ